MYRQKREKIMNLEYDTKTRRIKVQIKEETYRIIEKLADTNRKSISSMSRSLLEDAIEPYVDLLTPEDDKIIAQRILDNVNARMEARSRK